MKGREIDYDDLKRRGFLRSREDEYFILRTRMAAGNYGSEHLLKLSEIAKKYGRGVTHLTVRQGIEVPYVRFEDIEKVEKEIEKTGILAGASGARLRATTCCPGNSWCKRGLVNTFSLFNKIENEQGIKCSMDLPHKFKIAVSGCPNTCTRAQVSEIGIHGEIDLSRPEKRIGYTVYLGGCGGKNPRMGFKLGKVYTEEEVLSLIKRVVAFYKDNAKTRQRLALLIEETGKEKFLDLIGE